MADRKLFKELTESFGPPGFETEPAAILVREFAGLGELSRDGLGSVICRIPGKKDRPRIMIAAHMDEIGFLVKSITGDGYIRLLPIGGWWPNVLLGQRVLVRTRKGDFPGVIGARPPHELTEEERKKPLELDKMFVDLGSSEGFDVRAKLGVRPGDPVVPLSPFAELAGDLMLAKAWDDRGGCGILVELGRALARGRHPNTVYLVGTVQEEVGLRGARTAAEMVQPDVAIALDVSLSGEHPDRPRKDLDERLKNGAAILVHDLSMIPNTTLRDFVISTAERRKIRHHLTSVRGGYDTGVVHVHRTGVPSVVVGWPTRYIHGHAGIVAASDLDAVVKLLTAVVQSLDQAVSESLRFVS